MQGVDDRDDRVKSVVLGNVVVHEERLANRAGVGHAGRFDDDALEIQLARLAALAQIVERTHEIAAHRAAHATIGQLDDFFILVLDEKVVVDAFGSEFVLDDGDPLAVIFGENALEQRGFARTKKSREDRDGNHFFQTGRGVHESTSFNDKRDGAQSQGRALRGPGNAGLHHSERRGANNGCCGFTSV